jgi:tryptophan synthase alpha chain
MNRIDQLFQNKKKNILSVFFTAGYPAIKDNLTIIKSLAESGVDMIEVGMPFSDPMADGPVIQESNKKALENGMNISLLFQQLQKLREITDIPVLLMGYLNPVFHYGLEKFCTQCRETGIDGLILPDLPVEIYQQSYKRHFTDNNLHNIFLVAPTTSEERLKKILPEAGGFVYMVSSSSTTGTQKNSGSKLDYVKTLKEIREDIPVMVGFGIDSREKFQQVCEKADGGIIGSAFVRALENENGAIESRIRSFVESISI